MGLFLYCKLHCNRTGTDAFHCQTGLSSARDEKGGVRKSTTKKRHCCVSSLHFLIDYFLLYSRSLKMMKSITILFTLLCYFVAAQDEDKWGGCQATFTGASVETLEKIEIGKRTMVCFHVGNSKDWARGVDYIRLSFQPEADQYSRMHIPNCKCSLG